MEEAENADCSLMDRDIMQVIYSLAKAGHHQHISVMSERVKLDRGYIPGKQTPHGFPLQCSLQQRH